MMIIVMRWTCWVLVSSLMQFNASLSHHWSFLEHLSSRLMRRIKLFLLLSFLLLLFLLLMCMRALLARLRKCPTLWTHIFHLTFYRDLSPALTMFLSGFVTYFDYVSCDDVLLLAPYSSNDDQVN